MTEYPHDHVYRQALAAAKRDYDALIVEQQKLTRLTNALRNVINNISILLNEDVDDDYQYPYNRRPNDGSPSLRKRSTGRPPNEAQHDTGG